MFFAIVGGGASRAFLTAGEWTALATIGLLAAAFVITFQLPKRAREIAGAGDHATPEPPVRVLAPAVEASAA